MAAIGILVPCTLLIMKKVLQYQLSPNRDEQQPQNASNQTGKSSAELETMGIVGKTVMDSWSESSQDTATHRHARL
jgi:hypothetical protein